MAWRAVTTDLGGAPDPGWIPGAAACWRADREVVFGGVAPLMAFGAGAPAVTVAGIPGPAVQSVDITITLAGIRGVATCNIDINGVSVFAGLTAAAVGPFDGLTVNFPAGAYLLIHEWTTVPAVTSWTDYVSGNVLTQAVLANMPAWIAPGLVLRGWPASGGGKAGLRSLGNQWLVNSSLTLAQPFTGYCVLNLTATVAANSNVFEDASDEVELVLGSAPDLVFTCDAGAHYVEWFTGTAADLGIPMLASFIANGANSQFPIAHTNMTQGATGINGGLTLFASTGLANILTGDVQELDFYSAALTPPQNGAFMNYACGYYGLS